MGKGSRSYVRRRLTHVESAPVAATMESTETRGPQQGAALMKRTTKYVALDVHQATTSASVREESGRVIARNVCSRERAPARPSLVDGCGTQRHLTGAIDTDTEQLRNTADHAGEHEFLAVR